MGYFFFTEPEKLNNQVQRAYGPGTNIVIDNNEYERYLVTSKHTASIDPKAISICDGQIFVQEQIGNPSLLNLIFKPITTEPFSIPKIKYFIYKGIKKESLVDQDNIHLTAKGTNSLIDNIWNSFEKFNNSGAPEKSTIGLHNSINGLSGDAMVEDVFSLSVPEVKFWDVKGGASIGTFDKNSIGFEIVLDSPFYKPKLELSRTQETYLTAKKLGINPSDADFFDHWHDKDVVINFIDPCAFFACFYNIGLGLINDNLSTKMKGEDLFDQMISKFLNKNKCYIDIRNDFNFSLNYFKNYGVSSSNNSTEIKIRKGSNTTTTDYYENKWPVFFIDLDNTIVSSQKYQMVGLQLPAGNNIDPLLYFGKAYVANENFPAEYQNSAKFKTLTFTSGYTEEFSIGVPCLNGNLVSSYTILKYCRRDAYSNSGTVPTQIYKTDYLDSLFPLVLNFDYQSSVYKSKVYEMDIYLDVSESHHYEAVFSLGLSYDGGNITLIANPENIRTNEIKRQPLSITSDFDSFGTLNVFEELNKLELSSELVKTTLNIANAKQDILQFKTNNTDIEGKFNVPDLRKVIGMNITKEQWESIISLGENFLQKYPIYLSILNKEHLEDDDGKYFTSLDLALKGYQIINNQLTVIVLPANINLLTYGIV